MKILVCPKCKSPYMDTDRCCPNCGETFVGDETNDSSSGLKIDTRYDNWYFKSYLLLISFFLAWYVYGLFMGQDISPSIVSYLTTFVISIIILLSVLGDEKIIGYEFLLCLLCGYLIYEMKLELFDFDYDVVMYGDEYVEEHPSPFKYSASFRNLFVFFVTVLMSELVVVLSLNKKFMIVPIILMVVLFFLKISSMLS